MTRNIASEIRTKTKETRNEFNAKCEFLSNHCCAVALLIVIAILILILIFRSSLFGEAGAEDEGDEERP